MIEFLLKGLIRDRSRSLFPVLMVSAGAFLTVLLYSFMRGAIGDMVDSSARFDTGHVKIMTRAYSELSDQMPNDLALLEIGDLVKQLNIARDRETTIIGFPVCFISFPMPSSIQSGFFACSSK